MNAFDESLSMPIGHELGRPNPIATKVPDVLPMLPELIPESLRAWLTDVSYRMQTPADFATVSAIVVISSVIGSGCAVRPKQCDDWEVIPNVWGACIGRPSVVLKSPSMSEPMGLLDKVQAIYGEEFELKTSEFEADKLFHDAALKDIEKRLTDLAKGKGKTGIIDPDLVAALKHEYAQMKKSENPEPSRRLFKTNETSIQAMTLLQNENEGGVLVFRDELTGLLARWDREDHADERAYYLEGWNGNGSYTDIKITRGLTDAKNICISLLGGIQPDKLKRYLYQALKGNNDGLMQRLQLAVYPDVPKGWVLVDSKPNREQKQRVYDLLLKLAEMDFCQCGATQDDYDGRPYFRFDSDAQSIFNDWLTELQTKKIENEDNPLMLEHLGKYRSLMPSLAMIFHCIELADGKVTGDISASSAELAVEWCNYLESHARRIYAMAESPEHEAAMTLSKKIIQKLLPDRFTAKTVYDKQWHGLKDRQQVEAACEILMDENWLSVEIRTIGKMGGRPPLPEYSINPAVFFS
ncbi:YfjI family protein [Methylophaga sp. OBS1]|uniref:YfjI family protein n=1 Tax=Methylophaga sp. OBS1 TaxID=2991933 RepID=UPI00225527A4|nr:YfjI family protein [Methylophaga sp. OBS1]MCX4192579.1 YfjI family protein [Methylophaga sp. OBS1]